MDVPDRILRVRPIGDASDPHSTASSSDGATVVLEPGEQPPLFVAYCRLSASGSESWTLPNDTSLIVTERRLAFLAANFDSGGGWVGFGAVGLTASLAANAVSKRRAANRSAGLVAIGHIRHEWVTSVRLRHVKALIGLTDTYVDLGLSSASGPLTIELWGRAVGTEGFARWFVNLVSYQRLTSTTLTLSAVEKQLLTTNRSAESGTRHTDGPRNTGLRWTLPGAVDPTVKA